VMNVEFAISNYSLDADRARDPEPIIRALRRRLDGRFPVDPFGADPLLQDVIAPAIEVLTPVRVEFPERLPDVGPAVLVSNRGLGIGEPIALAVAVRKIVHRRLRVVGTPEVPLLGPTLRKLGGVGLRSDDVGALLRANHLVAVPLGLTWLRTGAGAPPLDLLVAALGYPVIPVAVRAGGPMGLSLRPWRVVIGEPVEQRPGLAKDQLAAAELAERAREAVAVLLA
jgi:1-acyl-sn-glycerol-3-phosphate acyltransferase